MVSRNGRFSLAAALLFAAIVGSPARGQTLLWHVDEKCVDLGPMGDVDGDGITDLVVDAQNATGVKILSGADGHEIAAYTLFQYPGGGFTVAGLGDVDGDGYLDFVVGNPVLIDPRTFLYIGEVTVVSGKDGSTLYHVTGWASMGLVSYESGVGQCVAGVGDVDGDGYVDLAYGIDVEALWVSGPSRIVSRAIQSKVQVNVDLHWQFDDSLTYMPHALASLGDVDGDGMGDYAASSRDLSTYIGSVEVHEGGGTGSLIWSLQGTYADEHFGIAVGSSPDLDGDGVRELLVGSTGSNEFGTDTGRVDVYSGKTGVLLLQLFGEEAGQRFGIDVDGIGDVDGDGKPDIVVASYGTYGTVDGRMELFSGADGRQLARIDEAVFRVRGAGDLNGDGRDDVVATDNSTAIDALSFDLGPTLASVTPPRDRYDRIGSIALQGRGFTSDPNLVVTIDGVPATGLAVASFTDLTCTAPPLEPGPHDVAVTTKFGTATLAGGLLATPAAFVDGDAALGATIDLRLEFDALDFSFAIVGFAPAVSIPTPPFHGALEISPFRWIAALIAWPTDEYVLPVTIPNDPSLVGMTGLFQSMTGPKLGGKHKDGSWTNVATIAIH